MREIETKAKMKINGLLLPQHLITLVSQGLWKRPSNTDALQKLTGCKSCHEFDFLSFESMKRESNPTHLIEDDKLANIYWLRSSLRMGKEITDTRFLDIDKAIIIALNWDEEAICLDYRSSMDKPRVVASCIDNDRIGQWKVIASDIETFTKAIGLD